MTDAKIKLSERISKETYTFYKNHNKSIYALDHKISSSYKALSILVGVTLLFGVLGDFKLRSELKKSGAYYTSVSNGINQSLLVSYLSLDFDFIGKYIDKESYNKIQEHLNNKVKIHSEQYLSSGYFSQVIYIRTELTMLKVTFNFNKGKLLYISIN